MKSALRKIAIVTLLGSALSAMAQENTSPVKTNAPNVSQTTNLNYQKAYNSALAAYLQRDYEKAIQEGLDVLPDDPNGDLHAMLGDSFFQLNAKGQSEKNKKGVLTARALMQAVLNKNPENKIANNTLGNIYSMGLGVPIDNEKAFNYFKKNADNGYALDAFNAGQVAQINGDLKEALKYYELTLDLAKKDNISFDEPFIEAAYKNMAYVFYGKNKDFHEQRVKHLDAYAEKPIRAGVFLLEVALDYYNGVGVKKDPQKALAILHEVADMKNGVDTDFNLRMAAKMALVEAYLLKDLKDDEQAFYYAYLTERDDMLQRVAHLPVSKEFKEAYEQVSNGDKKGLDYFKSAAEKGNKVAKSVYALLNLSGLNDKMAKEDIKKSVDELEKAFSEGNYLGLDTLVVAYLHGVDGVEKDLKKAKEFLEIREADKSVILSEEERDRLEFLIINIDYETGRVQEAISRLKVLADKGNVEAIAMLSIILEQTGNVKEAKVYRDLLSTKGKEGENFRTEFEKILGNEDVKKK